MTKRASKKDEAPAVAPVAPQEAPAVGSSQVQVVAGRKVRQTIRNLEGDISIEYLD